MWAYASLFWAHALVGACLVFAFVSALKVRESTNARGDFLWGLAVGLAAGWATVTEYPAAPASAMLALLALSQAWSRGNAARWRVVAGVGVGAGICVMGLLGYLHAAVGAFRPRWSAAGAECGARGGGGGSGRGGRDLRDGSVGISARGVWDVSAELFLLRSEFVFVHAAARIFGADLSSPRQAAEAAFRVLARTAVCIASDSGRSSRALVVVEREGPPPCGSGGSGHCLVLLFVQCVLLLVEGRAVVRSAVRGRKHSVVMRRSGRRMAAGYAGVAARADRSSSVQRVPGADGGFDDFAIAHAG